MLPRRWSGLRTVACLLLFATAATAADPTVGIAWENRGCLGASCQVQVVRGSGVAVGYDATRSRLIILSAGHVFEGRRFNEPIWVARPGSPPVRASLLAHRVDRETDLAVLAVPATAGYPTAPLGESPPASGDPATGTGFKRGVEGARFEGRVISLSGTWLQYTAAMPEGCSGGPIRDSGGRVVAIHMGVDSATRSVGMGNHVGVIRSFCSRELGFLPLPAEPVRPPPCPPTATPTPEPRACPPCDLSGLEREVADLKARLKAVAERPITVEIYDPATGRVKRKDFPPGEPIRLKLPEQPRKE